MICTAPVKGHSSVTARNSCPSCSMATTSKQPGSLSDYLDLEEPTTRELALNLADEIKKLVPSVNSLSTPEGAKNRCHAISTMICDTLSSQSTQYIGITSATGNHFACYIEDLESDDDSLVLDFTMRQFDPDSEFPLIMKASEWEQKVKKSLDIEDGDDFALQIEDHMDDLWDPFDDDDSEY